MNIEHEGQFVEGKPNEFYPKIIYRLDRFDISVARDESQLNFEEGFYIIEPTENGWGKTFDVLKAKTPFGNVIFRQELNNNPNHTGTVVEIEPTTTTKPKAKRTRKKAE